MVFKELNTSSGTRSESLTTQMSFPFWECQFFTMTMPAFSAPGMPGSATGAFTSRLSTVTAPRGSTRSMSSAASQAFSR